jgi:hypothetical protein
MSTHSRPVSRYTGPPVTTPLSAANYPAPILDADTEPVLANDVLDKVNAGARLVFALYLHPQARELFASSLMTPALLKAYMACARAWGL